MTSVHVNSVQSYDKYHRLRQTNKDKILAYSLITRHFTTTMVAERIGVAQSTIKCKINELVESGDLVREFEKHPCAITGNNAMWYYNPKYTNQLRLM